MWSAAKRGSVSAIRTVYFFFINCIVKRTGAPPDKLFTVESPDPDGHRVPVYVSETVRETILGLIS